MTTPAHDDPIRTSSAIHLCAILLLGGSLHFLAPRFFDGIIPGRLPGDPRTYTYASGAGALAIGTGLLIPRTRRGAATLAAAFFVAVMPAKLQLAVTWCHDPTKSPPAKLIGVVQLFWQAPLIAEAWRLRGDLANPRRRRQSPHQTRRHHEEGEVHGAGGPEHRGPAARAGRGCGTESDTSSTPPTQDGL